DTKLMGYSGKGSLQLHKVNSRMVKALLSEIKEGKDPRFTLIGKLADPNSNGAERIAIKNVSFDDLTLFDFEVGAVGQTECPFTFTDIECIDLI
ncbi:MAG: phage tail tube protein, partial [Peptostreptococcaceae bacterium]|nr:phage tail tube protein [Peptostreptococcaceae bacterium]